MSIDNFLYFLEGILRSLKPFELSSVEFIQNTEKNKPFFLTLSYFDPYPPYFAPSEYVANYAVEKIEIPYYIPQENDDTPFHTRVQRHTWQANQRTIMARTRDWKLIINESRPTELYKMERGWVGGKRNCGWKRPVSGNQG